MRGLAVGPLILLAVALGACSAATPDAPEPATETLVAHGPDATGPINELGRGDAHGTDWRYAIYPSDDGWCLQLELGGLAGISCDTAEPMEGQAFWSVNHTETGEDEQVVAIDGVVSAETATVWLIADGGRGRRIPALLMPLDQAGIDAQAFVGLPPPAMNVTHVMAVALNGRILETYELPQLTSP